MQPTGNTFKEYSAHYFVSLTIPLELFKRILLSFGVFFNMDHFLQILIEYVTILPPFYALVFLPQGMWTLHPDQGLNPCLLHWKAKS